MQMQAVQTFVDTSAQSPTSSVELQSFYSQDSTLERSHVGSTTTAVDIPVQSLNLVQAPTLTLTSSEEKSLVGSTTTAYSASSFSDRSENARQSAEAMIAKNKKTFRKVMCCSCSAVAITAGLLTLFVLLFPPQKSGQ